MVEKLVENARRRYKKLKQDRLSWIADWKSLSEQFLPRRMVLLSEGDQTNDGNINRTLMDDAPVRAMRVLSAGLQGGLTSPARPWFKLGMQDAELQEQAEVKNWLGIVQKRMSAVMSRSNFYSAIHTLYAELATFGTAAMFIVEDLKTVFRCVSLTAGEYCAASDHRDRITVLFREYQMTADQLVQEFGGDNVSRSVKDAYESPDKKDEYFTVVHASFPNEDLRGGMVGYKGKEFLSIYWEDKSQDKTTLAIRGFDEQPFVAPRWEVKGNDVYGTSPAVDTLSDAKQLQTQKKTMLKAMHKAADPPMNAPPTGKHWSIAPGAVNYYDATQGKFEAAINVRSDPQSAMVSVEATKKDISEGLYNDLFKMLAFSNDNMTATEVRQRVEEKLILLGPVLERLQSELLDPIIDRIFGIMLRVGYFPEPPEVLQGRDLRVEYISLLASAQKMLGTATIEQFFTFVQAQAQVYQEALDVYNFDEASEEYADMLGVPPEIIRGADERKAIRVNRAQAQQMALEAQAVSQGVQDARNLSQTNLEGDNALTALTGGLVNGQGA